MSFECVKCSRPPSPRFRAWSTGLNPCLLACLLEPPIMAIMEVFLVQTKSLFPRGETVITISPETSSRSAGGAPSLSPAEAVEAVRFVRT